MKKILLLVILISSNFYASAQWTSTNSPAAIQFSGVFFTSTDTGYIGGANGEIYKTIDGGNNWVAQASGIPENIFSIYFVNDTMGYACSGGSAGASILNTSDGGQNWVVQASPTASYLLEIFFVNESVGYSVGYNGVILKTVDGGQNWVPQNTGTTQNLRSVHFINEDTGFVATANSEILKTTDGGATWTSYPSGVNPILLTIFFVNENIGFAAGGSGTIIKTTDGGETWSALASGSTGFFQSIYFVNAYVGYAVGGSGIVSSTTDGGATWDSQFIGNFSGSFGWYGLTFIDDIGYAVGYEGNISKTDCIPYLVMDNQTACNSYTWVDSISYTESNNTASYTIDNPLGCDSVIALNLTINSIDTSVTQLGATLTSNVNGATYQWVDCDNGHSELNGETNQTFSATSNGNFAVVITQNGCIDTSSCYNVTGVGIVETDFENELILYPNPTDGEFAIDLGSPHRAVIVTMLDLSGKLIKSYEFSNSQLLNISIDALPGVYILAIETTDKKALIRLIKE